MGLRLRKDLIMLKKKPIAIFTVGSKEYSRYAIPMLRSLVKFVSPKDVDIFWYTNETNPKVLKKVPADIKLEDLNPLLVDPAFYFRQKPVLMDMLLDEYEYVIGMDSDMLILGDLDYVLKTQDMDVGTIYNWNRFDQQFYPMVEIARIGIYPAEYFNCSLVACRSKQFAHNWLVNCFSPQFDRVQYREQDILNVMCYYGNWNVRCFDLPDNPAKHFGWYGIIAKGELSRAIVKDGKVIVPKGFGDTPFPPEDVQIHAISLGGGHGAIKDNWNQFFTPEVMDHINKLIK